MSCNFFFRSIILIAIAHIEIWVRLLEIKVDYLSNMKTAQNKQERDNNMIYADIKAILQILCTLNRKASLLGSSVALASSSLTDRLIFSYLIETKDTNMEKIIDKNLDLTTQCMMELQ